jgi:hypothetical protein
LRIVRTGVELARNPGGQPEQPGFWQPVRHYAKQPGAPNNGRNAYCPGVHAHSIIAVAGNGPVEGSDGGVVEYSSSHLEGVDSEYIVRSSHST